MLDIAEHGAAEVRSLINCIYFYNYVTSAEELNAVIVERNGRLTLYWNIEVGLSVPAYVLCIFLPQSFHLKFQSKGIRKFKGKSNWDLKL